MKLAVSNLAWNSQTEAKTLDLLRRKGVTGIEVAPTRVWPDWEGATPAAARSYRKALSEEGFVVPALQAVVFGRVNLSLFESEMKRTAFIDHMRYVADLASALGARTIVYGAPKSRDRGNLDKERCFSIAVDVFAQIGQECLMRGTCLCIEPNPDRYGCNFVTSSAEGLRLVEAVSSSGFRLHLDSAAMMLAGENIADAIKNCVHVMEHYHASEPDLSPFEAPQVDHPTVARALHQTGYAGWISIEMRATDDPIQSIETAVEYVRRTYSMVLGT